MRTKLIKPHNKDCRALKYVREGSWKSPWAFIEDEASYGRKNTPSLHGGYTRWRYCKCNITDCKGEIAFAENDLIAFLPHGDPK